jgi:hypothetical protein
VIQEEWKENSSYAEWDVTGQGVNPSGNEFFSADFGAAGDQTFTFGAACQELAERESIKEDGAGPTTLQSLGLQISRR